MNKSPFLLAFLVAAPMSAAFGQEASEPAHGGHVNPSFEQPVIDGEIDFVTGMEGWHTTDNRFEIWRGFDEVQAHDGKQCVELNADEDGTLFQDSDGIQKGALLDFTFAHRGRNGKDTMRLTITDLGPDGEAGTSDDKELFQKEYSTGNDAWAVYDSKNEEKIVALGNKVRFAYTAVFGTAPSGNDKSQGNLLDAADFGVGVLESPVYTFVNNKGDSAAELHLIMHDTDERVKGPQGQDNHVYEIEMVGGGWLSYPDKGAEGPVDTNAPESQKKKFILHRHSKGFTLVAYDNGANQMSVDGVNPKGGGTPTGKFKLRRANAGGAGMEDQVFEMFRGGATDSVPLDAAKLDIKGGPFSFGYGPDDNNVHSFTEFTNTDYPYTEAKSIERKNSKANDWWSVSQNTSESAVSVVTGGYKIDYPPRSEGAAILHPGYYGTQKTKARYTALEDGKHKFKYTMSLIMQKPTGVGVHIYGPVSHGTTPLWKADLATHKEEVVYEFEIQLNKGEHVTLVVDNGPGRDYQRDHLLLSAAAWVVK